MPIEINAANEAILKRFEDALDGVFADTKRHLIAAARTTLAKGSDIDVSPTTGLSAVMVTLNEVASTASVGIIDRGDVLRMIGALAALAATLDIQRNGSEA